MEKSQLEQQLIIRATSRLAKELNVQPDDIALIMIESVQWPDASLGCPKPSQMYAQMIIPGYRIVLQVGGKKVEFHTSNQPDSPLIRC